MEDIKTSSDNYFIEITNLKIEGTKISQEVGTKIFVTKIKYCNFIFLISTQQLCIFFSHHIVYVIIDVYFNIFCNILINRIIIL